MVLRFLSLILQCPIIDGSEVSKFDTPMSYYRWFWGFVSSTPQCSIIDACVWVFLYGFVEVLRIQSMTLTLTNDLDLDLDLHLMLESWNTCNIHTHTHTEKKIHFGTFGNPLRILRPFLLSVSRWKMAMATLSFLFVFYSLPLIVSAGSQDP